MTNRSLALAAIASLVLPLVAALASPTFSHPTVATAQTTGEPLAFVDPNDPGAAGNPATVYVVSPEVSTLVWKSTDGGGTWSAMAASLGGGGDSDIAIDATGRVYVADLFGSGGITAGGIMPVSNSSTGASSWASPAVAAAPGGSYDRPWIAAHDNGTVVVTGDAGGVLDVYRSTDYAHSFAKVGTIATDSTIQGPMHYGADGTLWNIYHDGTNVRYAKSSDNGTTWTTGAIAPEISLALFPVLAVDADNDAYAVWAAVTSAVPGGIPPLKTEIKFSRSIDGGATWTTASTLSDPAKTVVFPWVVAGAKGKVDVSWAEARNDVLGDTASLGPDLGLPITHWDVRLAQSLNANESVAAWDVVTAAPTFHTGSICTSGLGCVGPQNLGVGNVPTPFDRRHLDFFGMAADGLGNAIVAYTQDRPFPGLLVGDLVLSWVDVKVAVQGGGPTIA